MARTTKEQALKTRQRILDTAVELFYNQGVTATTLEHIAEHAGLTRGAIYWHFKNKTDLICAIHDQFHISILETVFVALQDEQRPAFERLESACLEFLLSLTTDPFRRKIMTIFMFKCDYSGDMLTLLQQQNINKQAAHDLFEDCFSKASGQMRVPAGCDSGFLADALISYMTGIIKEYLGGLGFERFEEQIPHLIAFFFDGLRK